jgi:catechol 2,3-dioxygenase
MDAPNPSANATFASRTPLHIGAVGLTVRDLDRAIRFYRDAIGLSVLDQDATSARLGAGGTVFLELLARPDALRDDAREAGLYHTAFLMPTRGDLGRWLVHAARSRVPLSGASDHSVSEAIYLDDPEGNGVEVYWDRPKEQWQPDGDLIKITTDPLDINDLAASAGPEAYTGAPGGMRIGHIHLRVGDIAATEAFYRDTVGLNVTRRGRHAATFMSSGGYHHHIGANLWHSNGAGPRDPNRAGLAWFAFEAADPASYAAVVARLKQAGAELHDIPGGVETDDPWGTRVRVVQV